MARKKSSKRVKRNTKCVSRSESVDYKPFFAIAVILALAAIVYFGPSGDLSGHAIAGVDYGTIVIDDNADSTAIIAAARVAQKEGIANTVLLSQWEKGDGSAFRLASF